METLLTLFIFGSFWFWSLIAVATFLFIVCLENEHGGWATFLLITTVAAVIGLGNTEWLTWIFANPVTVLTYVAGYLVIGIIYGVFKWWMFVRDRAINYRTAKRKWINSQNLDPKWQQAKRTGVFTGEIKELWVRYVNRTFHREAILKPFASDHKSLITGWMVYWPWSALWTLINDPVRRFFNWVYDTISGLLQKISDRAFKDIDIELEEGEDESTST